MAKQTNIAKVATTEVETSKTETAVSNVATESKSAQIRRLMASGMTQYKVAKQLGIRPQFVSNVIRAARAKQAKKSAN